MEATTVTAMTLNPRSVRGRLLKTEEAAERLNLSPGTLQCWRVTGRQGLPYIKAGRHVRYREEDIDEFLRRNTVHPVPAMQRAAC